MAVNSGDTDAGDTDVADPAGVVADQDDASTRPEDHTRRPVLLAFVAAAVALVVVPVVLSRLVEQPAAVAYTIEIPAGTAERLAAGEDVDLFPADLDFKLRDLLIVVNHDDVVHTIGPFEVEPGGRLERSFGETATISGFCSLHSSGDVTIEIGG